jgi:hypothetical protein
MNPTAPLHLLFPRHGLARGMIWLLAMSACLPLARPDPPGKLDAFEANLTLRKPPPEDDEEDDKSDSDSFLTELLGDLMGEIIGSVLAEGGMASLQRMVDPEAIDFNMTARLPGDPLIPILRLDVVGQKVQSDIEALGVRGEGGYGPVAVQVDFSRYWEQTPGDQLNLIRSAGLYRMSCSSHVEVDLGLGALTVQGDRTTSNLLFTLPVLVHPHENWGVEFRPAWSERYSDYDLALLLTHHYTSLKLGYRWVHTPDESLDGPYAGFSVRL